MMLARQVLSFREDLIHDIIDINRMYFALLLDHGTAVKTYILLLLTWGWLLIGQCRAMLQYVMRNISVLECLVNYLQTTYIGARSNIRISRWCFRCCCYCPLKNVTRLFIVLYYSQMSFRLVSLWLPLGTDICR